jgi:FAD/FMN-containing dehydrogenase
MSTKTGLIVGSIPDESGTQVVLSRRRMTVVRAIDPHNMTITVEAGCVLQMGLRQLSKD